MKKVFKPEICCLALVVIIAFALRVLGWDWGLQDNSNVPRFRTYFDEVGEVDGCNKINQAQMVNGENFKISLKSYFIK